MCCPWLEWDTLNIGMCLKPAVLDSSKYSIKLKPVVGFVTFVIYLEIFPTSNCRKPKQGSIGSVHEPCDNPTLRLWCDGVAGAELVEPLNEPIASKRPREVSGRCVDLISSFIATDTATLKACLNLGLCCSNWSSEVRQTQNLSSLLLRNYCIYVCIKCRCDITKHDRIW